MSKSGEVDPFDHLKIALNSDGTITRQRKDPATLPTPDPTLPVLTQDATINQSNKTFARIFLPREALDHSPSTRLPLIVYFHGGGFVLFSAASDFFHDACVNLANDTNSIVVSVEYRLAPEHRLPAAYDDAVESLHWIKAQSNDWLRNHADYSNCYLMGSSAGANIAYHAGLRVAAEISVDGNNYLEPIKIRGLILSQPFFGGTKRVPSEVRLVDDPVLAPHVCDLLWELSLPVGVDRDHEYCNPTAGDGPVVLDRVRQLAWRVLVSGCHEDPLVDHQMALARLIEECSKSLVGITGVISEIQKEKKGRDVYILGSANVGKSAFINALLKTMAINDPVAASAQRYKPIQSAVPGTTLGPIQINAFLGGGKLYDTPGVHLYHRQTAVVHSEDLSILAPQSRLRGRSFPSSIVSSDNVEEGASTVVNGLNAFSIFWGGLVRIDVLKVLPETCLTFYGPKRLPIHMVPTEQAVEFYQKELGVLLTPPSGGENAENWKGLESERKLQIKFEDVDRPACDIAISGLGWFTVEPVSRSLKMSQPKPVETAGEVILAVHLPKPVEIFVRPPIPVGKAGAEWYQYVELTEKEEEMRPKWYF